MNQITNPVQVVVDEIERLQHELAAANNIIQTLSERLTAALDAKHSAETEAQRSNEFVNVFRGDMEKLASENAELENRIKELTPKPGEPCGSCGLPIMSNDCGAIDKLLCDRPMHLYCRYKIEAEQLRKQVEELRRDAERWKYVEENHSRAHSPHMDGTFGWAFRGPLLGRFKTFREAIDAAMKEAK